MSGGKSCIIENEWNAHKARALAAIEQIGEIHNTIAEIAEHSMHLQSLDNIASTLSRLEDTLVGPATGRRQIPLVSHLITILILGAFALVLLLEHSTKSVEVGMHGIVIKGDSTPQGGK